MEGIIPSNTTCEQRSSTNSYFNKILRIIKFNKTLQVAPIKKAEYSLDNTNDITTYIRCVFHDLRGPINNISLGAEVLFSSLDKDSEEYNVLNIIKDSCLFLSDSLDGFLNINTTGVYRIDDIELKYEPFNIVGLVKKIKYILFFNMMNKKIELKYNIKANIEWVIG